MPLTNAEIIARLARFTVRTAEWQLAAIQMPKWVAEPGIEPFRALVPLARCPEVPFLGGGDISRPGDALEPGLLTALLRLASHAEVRYLPSVIAMRDATQIAGLEPLLRPLGLTLYQVDSVPLIDEVEREMRQDVAGPMEALSILAGEDCSMPRVRAFAETAALFFRAEPWHLLSDADVIIAEGDVPKDLGCFSVLGGARTITGVGFHANREAFERMQKSDGLRKLRRELKQWLLSFDDASHVPIRDSELWQDEKLALASPLAYPSFRAHLLNGDAEPADGERLVFGESLLRVLAETTEDELDSGRWTRTVMTADGERTLTLSLPGVLEEPLIPDEKLAELTPEGRAALALELAMRSKGRSFHRHVRTLLRHDPRSVDAFILLADETLFDDRRLTLLRTAFEHAQAEMDATGLGDLLGDHVGRKEVRRYLRVRQGLAEQLWLMGLREESIVHRLEILRLAPLDPLNLHVEFMANLVEAGQLETANELAVGYPEDASAPMLFASALVRFAAGNAAADAEALLRRAMTANRFAAKYLSGSSLPDGKIPVEPAPSGTEAEAVQLSFMLERAWAAVPGAAEWLKRMRREAKKQRK